MESFLIYILKSSLGIILFYLVYSMLMKKSCLYLTNRIYLMTGLLLSILIPLIKMDYFSNIISAKVNNSMVILLKPVSIVPNGRGDQAAFSMYEIAGIIYLAITGLMLFLFFYNLLNLWYKKFRGEKVNKDNLTIVADNKFKTPFSFFNTIYVPKKLVDENALGNIIKHEEIHIEQLHTLDILFIEFIKIFHWFNPFVWLYKKEITAQNEFFTDNAMISNGVETDSYLKEIAGFGLNTEGSTLASNYNSLLKRRLIMISDTKLLKSRSSVFVIIPLTLVLLFLTAVTNKPVDKIPTGITTSIQEKTVLPSFPGGYDKMVEFILNNLYYPEIAKRAGIQGKVFVSFMVLKDGTLKNIKVVKGIGSGCDEAALDVIKKMPKWLPGTIDGKKANIEMSLPIQFKLK